MLGYPLVKDFRSLDEDDALSRPRRKKAGPRPAPPPIELRFDELGAIVERTKAALSPDHAKLKAAMDTLAFVTAELQTTQTSLDRLRRLFGAKTEKTRTIVGPGVAPGAPGSGAKPAGRGRPVRGRHPAPGHGRTAPPPTPARTR